MSPIRAVIFDLDGTLLDTLEDIADSMNAVLERRGLATHGLDAYRRFVGDGVEMLVRRSLPEGTAGEDAVGVLLAAVREEYARRYADKTRPYAGVEEMLDALRRRGVPASVLSNKPQDLTDLCIRRFFAPGTFADARGVRPGGPRKPDPSAALEIAAALGVEPADTVFVGDTPTDVQTARNAGMAPVSVLWGFRTENELRQAGASRFLRHPSELASLF